MTHDLELIIIMFAMMMMMAIAIAVLSAKENRALRRTLRMVGENLKQQDLLVDRISAEQREASRLIHDLTHEITRLTDERDRAIAACGMVNGVLPVGYTQAPPVAAPLHPGYRQPPPTPTIPVRLRECSSGDCPGLDGVAKKHLHFFDPNTVDGLGPIATSPNGHVLTEGTTYAPSGTTVTFTPVAPVVEPTHPVQAAPAQDATPHGASGSGSWETGSVSGGADCSSSCGGGASCGGGGD